MMYTTLFFLFFFELIEFSKYINEVYYCHEAIRCRLNKYTAIEILQNLQRSN